MLFVDDENERRFVLVYDFDDENERRFLFFLINLISLMTKTNNDLFLLTKSMLSFVRRQRFFEERSTIDCLQMLISIELVKQLLILTMTLSIFDLL